VTTVISLVVFSASLLVLATPATAQPSETGFLNRQVTIEGTAYRYQIFVPVDYTPETRWPVVLFLHGAGERGSDGVLQTDVGLGRALRRDFRPSS
jgi:predicted peptidase